MDSWAAVWNTYHVVSTKRKIFKQTFLQAGVLDRLLLMVLGVLFLVSFVFYFWLVFHDRDRAVWGLLAMAASEMAFLVRLDLIRSSWISKEFGPPGDLRKAPDDKDLRGTRYLLFKSGLEKVGVFEGQMKGCIDLVNLQIDMASTEGGPQKKFLGFTLGVLSGIATTAFRSDKINVISLNTVAILMTAWLVSVLLSFFPSRLEKMKEMKYFLFLYQQELENNPKSQ